MKGVQTEALGGPHYLGRRGKDMPEAAAVFILLITATFGIAWVGGMDYQRFNPANRKKDDQ